MPLSGKAIKKRQQAADAKAGVVRDEMVLRKQATAKADVACKLCATSFKLTKKNVDARTHAASKHPESTFEACFPVCVAHEAELAKGGATDSGNNAKGGVGKTGGKKKDKGEDLSALLDAGLAGVGSKPKKGGKK